MSSKVLISFFGLILISTFNHQHAEAEVSTIMPTLSVAPIPEKFFGSFKLDRSENFDEFLASKGVNWFLRKMIQFSSITKVFGKSTNGDNLYNMANFSAKKNTEYNDWALGRMFQGEGFDGGKHNITFTYDNECDCIKEHHYRIENADDKGETYYYTMNANDELILMMKNDKVTCYRYFKRL